MSPRRGTGNGKGPEGTSANGAGANGSGDGVSGEDLEHEDAALELEEEFEEELAFAAEEQDEKDRGEKPHNVLVRLYRGETSFDFIGRRKIWFAASAFVILLGIISLAPAASIWASTSKAGSRGW